MSEINQNGKLNVLPAESPPLQQIAANVPGVIFRFCRDPQGDFSFLYVSEGCRELFELESTEFIRLFDFVPTEDAEPLTQALEESAIALTRFEHEHRIITPSGVLKWVKVVSHPQRQDDGSIFWDGMAMNITAYKETEEQLRLSDQRFQQFSANVPGVLFQFQLHPDGTMDFPFASAGSRGVYELEPHEMLKAFDLVHPEDQEDLSTAIQDSARRLCQFRHEYRIITPSGRCKWVKAISTPTAQTDGSILWDGLVLETTQRKQAEGQLRLSEQRFRQIFQSLPMLAMQIYDRDRRLVDWNDASTAIYGYTREEAIGQKLEDLIIPPEMQDDVIQAVDQWVAGGDAIPASELSLLHKDGSRVAVYSTHFLLPNAQGEPEMYCLDVDLRDRQAAEAELQCSKNLLESVINTLPGGVFFKDRDLNYLGCNQFFAQVAGKDSPAELIGKCDYDMPWKREESDLFRECDRRVMESGQAEIGIVEPLQHADGKQAWSETSKAPLRDENGQVIGMVGMFQDVTEREKAAIALRQKTQELQQTQEILQLVINTLPGAVFWKDIDLVYQGSNEYFAQIAGVKVAGNITGKTDYELAWKTEEADFFRECDRRVIESDIPELGIIEPQLQANGKQAWLETNKVPLRDGKGQVIGIVGMFQDVTEREEAAIALRQKTTELEQALAELQQTQLQLIQTEKMSSLGQMVAGVAHEINNPVTFIHGNIQHAVNYVNDLLELIELYQQAYPDPPLMVQDCIEEIDLDFLQQDFRELIQSMRVGTERIREIVNSLRNFSRLDESAVKAVNLHEGIDSTLTILQTRLRAQDWRPDIQIVRDYGDLPLVECYAGQLNQVFMNIISNGIDALEERDRARNLAQMERDPSTLTLRTSRNDTEICIEIQDNGPGMDATVRDRLFDPFFTTKPIGKGTGLGLSISYQIITEKHGGNLVCQSEPGQSTTFIITLPLN